MSGLLPDNNRLFALSAPNSRDKHDAVMATLQEFEIPSTLFVLAPPTQVEKNFGARLALAHMNDPENPSRLIVNFMLEILEIDEEQPQIFLDTIRELVEQDSNHTEQEVGKQVGIVVVTNEIVLASLHASELVTTGQDPLEVVQGINLQNLQHSRRPKL